MPKVFMSLEIEVEVDAYYEVTEELLIESVKIVNQNERGKLLYTSDIKGKVYEKIVDENDIYDLLEQEDIYTIEKHFSEE